MGLEPTWGFRLQIRNLLPIQLGYQCVVAEMSADLIQIRAYETQFLAEGSAIDVHIYNTGLENGKPLLSLKSVTEVGN